jgi:hypothetical protein
VVTAPSLPVRITVTSPSSATSRTVAPAIGPVASRTAIVACAGAGAVVATGVAVVACAEPAAVDTAGTSSVRRCLHHHPTATAINTTTTTSDPTLRWFMRADKPSELASNS